MTQMEKVPHGPYRVVPKTWVSNPNDLTSHRTFELMGDAAQEAEFLHEEHALTFLVLDSDGDEIYCSKGAPE
jgi:hypothetical protein